VKGGDDNDNGGKSGIRKGKGKGDNDDKDDGECGISKLKGGNEWGQVLY
jgi:hypothetical protein